MPATNNPATAAPQPKTQTQKKTLHVLTEGPLHSRARYGAGSRGVTQWW